MTRRGIAAMVATMTVAAVLTGAPVHLAEAAAPPGEGVAVTNGPIAYTKSWRVLHTPGPDERVDIFKVRPTGEGNTRLTYFRDATRPKWAPTGNRIAFQRPAEVWLMRGDGSDKRKLTGGYLVDWLPDGGRVLVVRGLGVDGQDPTWVVHTVATGAEEELDIDLPLVPGLVEKYPDEDYPDYSEWSYASGDAALSPDGETLAVMLWRWDSSDGYSYPFGSIFTVGLDGTGLVRVPKYTYAWGSPRWSPNGQQLLYWAEEPRGYCASSIRSLRLDGSPGAVDIQKRCAQPDPTWSPDGRKILFVSGRSNSLQIASKDGERNRNVLPEVTGVYRAEPDWRAAR